MASVIDTINDLLVTQRSLSTSQAAMTASVQTLSSGMRITSVKDVAAGLDNSKKLRAQITGANVSARNANDAISMVSTAQGSMQEVSGRLQRMREMDTQGNNDSLDATQRGYISTEIQALRREINQVGTRTTFNGKSRLNGSISDGLAGTAASANYQPVGELSSCFGRLPTRHGGLPACLGRLPSRHTQCRNLCQLLVDPWR